MFNTLRSNLTIVDGAISGQIHSTTFGFNVIIEKFKSSAIVGLVEQTLYETLVYKRVFNYHYVRFNETNIFIKTHSALDESIKKSSLNGLEKINKTLEMIAVIMINESDILVVFRTESVIKYCRLEKVGKHLSQTIFE